jgi:hypothetical protein
MADNYGANPTNIQWTVVRGDTAKLRIDFFENDEVTFQDTSTWTYSASAYNPKTSNVDTLNTYAGAGYVEITAPPSITSTWGTGYSPVVAELSFDLQITIEEEIVWTPVIGNIVVIPDITPNNVL